MKLYITIKIVRNKDLRVVIFFISIDINRVGFGHVNFFIIKRESYFKMVSTPCHGLQG